MKTKIKGSTMSPTIPQEKTNLQGNPYDTDEWRYTMPDSAIKHLHECFEGDSHKVNAIQRAIELSIEHYTHEMEDDAQCARIIAYDGASGQQKRRTSGHFRKGIFCKVIVA
jgi:hypothetical protein